MPPQSVRCIVNRVYTERSKVYSVQCLVQLLTDILTDTANASHVGEQSMNTIHALAAFRALMKKGNATIRTC